MQSEGYNKDVHVTIYSMCGSSISVLARDNHKERCFLRDQSIPVV